MIVQHLSRCPLIHPRHSGSPVPSRRHYRLMAPGLGVLPQSRYPDVSQLCDNRVFVASAVGCFVSISAFVLLMVLVEVRAILPRSICVLVISVCFHHRRPDLRLVVVVSQ